MTIEELLSMSQKSFATAISGFDHNTCECYVRMIIAKLQGSTFEDYVCELIQVAMPAEGGSPKDVMPYYRVTKKLFPGVSADNDILGRLSSLMLLMIVQRLENEKTKP